MARGDSDIKRTGVSWKILKRNFCGHGLNFFSFLRGTNSDITFSSVIFFWLNVLKGIAKASVVHILSLNILRNTRTALLTHKRYDEHPVNFIWEVPPGKMDHSKRL